MTDTRIEDADIKHLVRAHWGDRAPTFDGAPHHGIHNQEQHDAWLDVLRCVTGGGAQRVLDVGCGTGFLTLLLAELGHAADGIDLAPAMLERACAKAQVMGLRVQFFEGDAESPRVADGSYDLLVERHVLWTLPHPDAALREWRRVLRPGGRVALIEGDWGRPGHVPPDYERIHQALPLYGGTPPAVLAGMLTAAGFHDVTVEPLRDARLWGEEPDHERYLITAVRP